MKRILFAGLASLAWAQGALGYLNQGIVQNPDFVINDPLFINDRGAQFLVYNLLQTRYRTFNTLWFTNSGLMEANVGFEFNTFSGGTTRWADTFYNDTFGVVNSGVSTNGFILPLGGLFAYSTTVIGATNVVSRGTLAMAPEGVLAVGGRNVDLSRSKLNVAAFESSPYGSFYPFGQFDGYWGVGDVQYNPAAYFGGFFGQTPVHWVTNRYYLRGITALASGTAPFLDIYSPSPSNIVINAAFVYNSDPGFTISAYSSGLDMTVVWSWNKTDPITGTNGTDYLWLQDTMGSISNVGLATNGFGPPSTGFRPTFIPSNYWYGTGPYFFGTPMAPGSTAGLFPNTNITREFTAYEIQFYPILSLPWEIGGRTFTNMPGRLDLVAEGPGSVLNLSRARISGGNSLVVRATNHFAGSAGAKIITPYGDLNLGTTNGFLSVSNLLAPVVPRIEGVIDAWSTRFTNVNSFNYTNIYHVLFVNSFLSPNVPPRMQNLTLRSTNVFISDVLNVLSNLTLQAEHVTIVSNALDAANPAGQLNLLSGQIFWASSTPRLLTLTNYGSIQAYNLMYFTNQSRPYEAFVNYGTVANSGSIIAADYFENSGLFTANPGVLALRGRTAWLHDGAWYAPGSDISLQAGSLILTNHVLQAGGALNLTATNLLDDGTLHHDVFTVTNKNLWTAGAGVRLLAPRPAQGSLLGTTVACTAPRDGEVQSIWSGADRGRTQEGFFNNAALGKLILDADVGADFLFTGVGAGSALYVDCLELRNTATNIDAFGNFPALVLDSNIQIYYAQALMNGVSVAERMNGRNGGRLHWVSAFTGWFSSLEQVYPDGTTNRLNAALAASCNLDSNNNGSANCIDPAPVWVPSQYQFRAERTNAPGPALVLSWWTVGFATNTLYVATNLAAPSWQVATQFVSAPVIGPPLPARYVAPLGPNPRFYRLRLDVPQP